MGCFISFSGEFELIFQNSRTLNSHFELCNKFQIRLCNYTFSTFVNHRVNGIHLNSKLYKGIF